VIHESGSAGVEYAYAEMSDAYQANEDQNGNIPLKWEAEPDQKSSGNTINSPSAVIGGCGPQMPQVDRAADYAFTNGRRDVAVLFASG
jgi:hypothetical protein